MSAYHSGRLGEAKAKLEASLAPWADPFAIRVILTVLLEVCIGSEDAECVAKYALMLGKISAPTAPVGKAGPADLEVGYYLAFPASLQPDQAFERLALRTFLRSPQESHALPSIYIRRRLLEARMNLNLGQPEDARLAIDRATFLLGALNDPARMRFEIATWLSETVELLSLCGDLSHAAAIYFQSSGFVLSVLPEGGPDQFRHLLRSTEFLADLGLFSAVKESAQAASKRLAIIDFPPNVKQWFRERLATNLAFACAMMSDLACAEDALEAHDALQRVSQGSATTDVFSERELLPLLLKIFVDLAAGRETPTPLVTALQSRRRWESSAYDPRWLPIYRRAAIALAHLQHDRQTGGTEIIEMGQSLVSLVTETISRRPDQLPLPNSTTRILLAVVAGQLIGDGMNSVATKDQDLTLAVVELLNRDVRSLDGDTTALLAALRNPQAREHLQSWLRLGTRMRALEVGLLRDLIARGQQGSPSRDDSVSFRYADRSRLSQYATERAGLWARVSDTVAREAPGLAPSVAEVQQELQENEAVLAVSVAPGGLLGLCIRSDRAEVVPSRVDIPGLARDAKVLINSLTAAHTPSESLDVQFPAEAAVRLHDALIRPFRGCVRTGDHLIWAPGGAQLSLPLAALLTQQPARVDGGYDLAAAHWLVNEFSISVVPSVRGFVAARRIARRRRPGEFAFLGIGDPVLRGQTVDGIERGRVVLRGAASTTSGRLVDLQELPETSDEIQGARQVFAGRTEALVREGATEGEFRRRPLSRYEYIHFATHGLIREEVPFVRETSLVLSPVSTTDSQDDGILEASEIADLTLNARIVVLSACNTVHFDYDEFNQGVGGLTTAFAAAGVPSAIVTLWAVDSITTTGVVTETFRNLGASGTTAPAQALASAQRRFLSSNLGRPQAHPRFWAPFVVFGDGGSVAPVPENAETAFRLEHLERLSATPGSEALRLATEYETGDWYVAGIGDNWDLFRARFSSADELIAMTLEKNVTAGRLLQMGFGKVISSGAVRSGGALGAGVVFLDDAAGRRLKAIEMDVPGSYVEYFGADQGSESSLDLAALITPAKFREGQTSSLVVRRYFGDQIALDRTQVLPWAFYTANSAATGAVLLVSLSNRFGESAGSTWSTTAYDVNTPCLFEAKTDLLLFDRKTLELMGRAEVSGTRIEDLVVSKGGTIYAVGAEDQCLRSRLVVLRLADLLKPDVIYREDPALYSEGKAVIETNDGQLVVAGIEKLLFDIAPAGRSTSESVHETMSRVSFESEAVHRGLLLELDLTGEVRRRDELVAGSDVELRDVLETESGIVLAGKVGGRAMWARVSRPAGASIGLGASSETRSATISTERSASTASSGFAARRFPQ